MSDITDSMARYIDNIPDGAAHTCSDLCIKPSCLIVRGKQEIESLRKERQELLDLLRSWERGLAEAHVELDALRPRLVEAEAQRDKMREALLLLLPGLVLDLRYADMDDDKEAMEARIQTVTEALSAADSAPHRENDSHD